MMIGRLFFCCILMANLLFGQNILSNDNDYNAEKSEELASLAVSYFKNNDLKKSTELLFKAKEFAEKTDDYALIARMNGSIAHQYVQLNLNDKAKFYLDNAIKQINKLPEGDKKKLLKTLSYLEIGNIDFDEENYQKASEFYKKSLKEIELVKNPDEQAIYHHRRSLYNIGNSYYYLKNDSAEIYLNKALAIKNNYNNEINYFIYNALSQVYADRKEYQRAIDTLKIVLKHKNDLDTRLLSDVYYNLSQDFKALNDQSQYSLYNEEFIKLNRSIRESEMKAISSAINAEQKDYKDAISDADSSKKNIVIIATVFVLILAFAIVFLLYRRKKERKVFENIIHKLESDKIISTENKLESPVEVQKDSSVQIPNSVEKDLLDKLQKFEESERFTNPKLTIASLALQLKTNTSYLSEVINKYKGKNFNTYINELRIAYICQKIYTNKEYQNYKISYLAEECGFASHSSFATVFRNITGISPSVFIREASKN
ncbi:helix-turn-helix domain-containing protein [Epilithonimonas zeae]|uniref:helix-turn-helix domain-containing protein n=1 Tax=Epilithonimonas zeae TaxID=1416779 RepID=UPI00200DFDB1|nr:helix-turn-helix domain-containing protein [Epilithonimonas zeae]UQB70294.1 helix-turn-helix domain-containing protein [Epilithonimonas zeae]